MTHWAGLVLLMLCGCNNAPNSITTDNVYQEVFEQYPQSWYPIPFPITGPVDKRFTKFDMAILEFMLDNKIPGASVAVYDGEHMYQKALGWADVESETPVLPESVFRIASISKTITAAGILHLHQEHKLDLEDKAVRLLQNANVLTGTIVDNKLLDITLRDLLLHQGGWDEDEYYDPMLRETIRKSIGLYALNRPVASSDILQYSMGQSLHYFPGSRFSYSNLGYVMLGRVIEAVSDQPYEAYIKSSLFYLHDLHTIRLGATLAEEKLPSEVTYYELSNEKTITSVIENDQDVLLPYGAFSIEALDAAAGWTATASELAIFAHLFYQKHSVLLSKEENLTVTNNQGAQYGFGVFHDKKLVNTSYWHSGSMSGTLSIMCITRDGHTGVLLMNARPEYWQESDKYILNIFEELFEKNSPH